MNLSRFVLLATVLYLTSGQTWASAVTFKMPGHENPNKSEHIYERVTESLRERKRERDSRSEEIHYDEELPGTDYDGNTVFETAELFKNKTFFTESFLIETAGTYQAILTDFEFPDPLKEISLNITTASESLATLFGPGTTTFEAEPGTYFISLFAKAGGRGMHDKGLREEWREWEFWGHERDRRYGNLGQYGVEISLQTSPIPIPAAIWLFATGLLGLVGFGRRCKPTSLDQ